MLSWSAEPNLGRSVRAALFRQLDPAARATGISATNLTISALIILSVLLAILETEPTIGSRVVSVFLRIEYALAAIFALEYALRFWAAAEDAVHGGGWRARWRWLRSPWAIIDLIGFLPTLLVGFAPTSLLRLIRVARILRLARLGRFSHAWALLSHAVTSRRYELLLILIIAALVMLTSASLLYIVEGAAQPELFGSIPRALWWSVVTLTTIGYGDVYPVTPLGKMLTGITAILGVGLIAAPAGIVAAALSDALEQERRALRAEQGSNPR
jgi:voltage-gated potassium channel